MGRHNLAQFFTDRVTRDGSIYIEVVGSITDDNRTEFKHTVLDAFLDKNKEVGVILDLCRCPYMNSTALGVLVAVARYVKGSGQPFSLSGVDNDLLAQLQLAKLDRGLFTVIQSQR